MWMPRMGPDTLGSPERKTNCSERLDSLPSLPRYNGITCAYNCIPCSTQTQQSVNTLCSITELHACFRCQERLPKVMFLNCKIQFTVKSHALHTKTQVYLGVVIGTIHIIIYPDIPFNYIHWLFIPLHCRWITVPSIPMISSLHLHCHSLLPLINAIKISQ